MSLTGSFFGTLVVLLTVGAFGAVVVFWPALGGRRPRNVVARAGLLLGVNVLVLLTAAVQLNNQFLFFADWNDLYGAFGGAPTSSSLQRGESARGAASIELPGPAAAQVGALQPLPPGTAISPGVTSYQVSGPASGVTGKILIALPPGYDDPQSGQLRYPVLETFSGYPGLLEQWVKTMALPTAMSQQVAAGRMRSALIVSPQTQIPAGVDTECVNGRPGTAQVETWLTQDVPAWVVSHFRVNADRTWWATIGLSAGGWCAAMAAMLHPSQYAAAIVLGGYFRPIFGLAYDPYAAGSALASRYNLIALAKRAPPPTALWVETSHADPVSYGLTADLLKAARPPLSVAATVLQDAGHRMSVWQQMLPNSLIWLGANVPGFRYNG